MVSEKDPRTFLSAISFFMMYMQRLNESMVNEFLRNFTHANSMRWEEASDILLGRISLTRLAFHQMALVSAFPVFLYNLKEAVKEVGGASLDITPPHPSHGTHPALPTPPITSLIPSSGPQVPPTPVFSLRNPKEACTSP
ncbi:hypothetical protein Pcinc_038881 [Petrolisthes cinctipes]|uniref:Uncharacterized protein n=1 Tax=Petrolisthes cinctipes TaxID=88211 RepID=A0AAE1BPK7_PETCI|nr:hypothetical protein Pcinc_038881 [Petrolisthes cinctipes]